MSTRVRFMCANCGEVWSERSSAATCCTTCEAWVGDGQCGKPRTWSAPMDSRLFPLGYCDEHKPGGVR